MSVIKIIRNGEELFHRYRWRYGIVVCPYCGSIHIHSYARAGNFTNSNVVTSKIAHTHAHTYRCLDCKRKFSDKTRTPLHSSKLPIGYWMYGIYELLTGDISSVRLAKKLGITQKSAWLMLSKIRYAMDISNIKLSGNIAQDEMYVGGCLSNYHYGRKLGLLRANGLLEEGETRYTKPAIYALNSRLKKPVFGMNDGNNIVLYVTPNPIKRKDIHMLFKKHVDAGNISIADESSLYDNWDRVTGCKIYKNNHHNNQYKTEEGYTSNRIENTFSWFKRWYALRVVHSKYTQLYLNEFCYRYNNRTKPIESRLEDFISSFDETVTYKKIKALDKPVKPVKHRTIPTISFVDELLSNPLVNGVRIGKTMYRK